MGVRDRDAPVSVRLIQRSPLPGTTLCNVAPGHDTVLDDADELDGADVVGDSSMSDDDVTASVRLDALDISGHIIDAAVEAVASRSTSPVHHGTLDDGSRIATATLPTLPSVVEEAPVDEHRGGGGSSSGNAIAAPANAPALHAALDGDDAYTSSAVYPGGGSSHDGSGGGGGAGHGALPSRVIDTDVHPHRGAVFAVVTSDGALRLWWTESSAVATTATGSVVDGRPPELRQVLLCEFLLPRDYSGGAGSAVASAAGSVVHGGPSTALSYASGGGVSIPYGEVEGGSLAAAAAGGGGQCVVLGRGRSRRHVVVTWAGCMYVLELMGGSSNPRSAVRGGAAVAVSAVPGAVLSAVAVAPVLPVAVDNGVGVLLPAADPVFVVRCRLYRCARVCACVCVGGGGTVAVPKRSWWLCFRLW